MSCCRGGDRILEGVGPGHLNASTEPGRIALLRRIVSYWPIAAATAFHPGAELVERHGAEHRYSLAEHLERTQTVLLQHSHPIQG
jgi:hypothetical protein